ncbi:MAG: hypothetical protein GXO77_04980 [Calditrichaeota bacterium]|nr:hypothetical protein [Calditrichota bacterium]
MSEYSRNAGVKTKGFRFAAAMLFFLFNSFANGFSQEVKTGGFVEIDHISYPKISDENKINSRNQGILQLELTADLNEKTAFFSAIEFRDDQSDAARNRVYLDEAYIDLFWDRFDMRVGKQIIIWGKADGVNPTDLITPWDYSDLLDTENERIGVIAVKARYFLSGWEAEGIVVPAFTASVLPSARSRWMPEFPDEAPNPLYPQFGPAALAVAYRFQSPEMPDESMKNALFAAKISASRAGWDFSFSYYHGWDDLAVFHQLSVIRGDTLFVTVQPRYHRLRAIGGDFSTTLGKFGLRGEAAYYLTDDLNRQDPEVDDPYFQYVVGLDRTFSNIIGENNLFVLVQWIHEVTGGDFAQSNPLSHVFQRAVSGNVKLELGAYASIGLEGVYDLERRGYYLRPELSYGIADGVNLNAAVDLPGGKAGSLFGQFKDNKRLQLKLKVSF